MDKLLIHINNLYNLELHYLEKVKKGSLSENHILTDGRTKYFLKQYGFDSKDKVEKIHLIKKYFADGGIPIILPIVSKEGDTIFSFENGYYALFPFITDKQLEKSSLVGTAVVSLGEMLGRIHLLGRDAKLPIEERFHPWRKEKSLEKIGLISLKLSKINNLTDFDKLALESIETKRKLIEENPISYEELNLPSNHLIHGDYLDHNVFFRDDNTVSHVFDLEKASYSPRTHELFRSMIYSFLSEEVNKENIDKAKLYLKSYIEVYPTSKEELKKGLKLSYLKSIHGLWTEGEHYLKNNFRADEFLKTDFRRIKYFSQNYEKFEKELLSDF